MYFKNFPTILYDSVGNGNFKRRQEGERNAGTHRLGAYGHQEEAPEVLCEQVPRLAQHGLFQWRLKHRDAKKDDIIQSINYSLPSSIDKMENYSTRLVLTKDQGKLQNIK